MSKEIKTKLKKIQKIRSILSIGSIFCVFSYIVLLGFTSVNVVTVKNMSKGISDSKSRLAAMELSYMNTDNAMEIQDTFKDKFTLAKNISYANSGINTNSFAVAEYAK